MQHLHLHIVAIRQLQSKLVSRVHITGNKLCHTLPTLLTADKLGGWIVIRIWPQKFQYSLNGLREGFHLQIEWKGINEVWIFNSQPKKVNDKILKELQAGRIECPFSDSPFPTNEISFFGVVPKIHQIFLECSIICHNLITKEAATSVQYAEIKDSVLCIKNRGNINTVAKLILDLLSGYYQLNVEA